MTAPEDHMPEDEGMAAEYVLGTLPLPDRLAAEALIRDDPRFAALVVEWEDRLAPLNNDVTLVVPPNILPKIEARLFPEPQKKRSRWRIPLFGGAFAALALLALLVVVPLTRTAETELLATLSAADQPVVIEARLDRASGELSVTRTEGPAAEAGQDYQFWIIPAGGAPEPLGLIRDGDLVVRTDGLAAGVTLAVSVEPEGGSPTGQPTGPVILASVIEDI